MKCYMSYQDLTWVACVVQHEGKRKVGYWISNAGYLVSAYVDDADIEPRFNDAPIDGRDLSNIIGGCPFKTPKAAEAGAVAKDLYDCLMGKLDEQGKA